MADVRSESCENCGRQIGKLETPMLWQEHVVCGECHRRLSACPAPAAAPIRGRNGTLGWAMVALGTFAIVIVAGGSLGAYGYHQQELAAAQQAQQLVAFLAKQQAMQTATLLARQRERRAAVLLVKQQARQAAALFAKQQEQEAATLLAKQKAQQTAALQAGRQAQQAVADRRLRKIRGLERLAARREAVILPEMYGELAPSLSVFVPWPISYGKLIPNFRTSRLREIKNALDAERRRGYDGGPTAARYQRLSEGYRVLRGYDNDLIGQLRYWRDAIFALDEKKDAESPKKVAAARAKENGYIALYTAAVRSAKNLFDKVRALE